MLATRSLLFNALFYLNLVVLMIIGLPTMLFGRRAVFALARLWGAISVLRKSADQLMDHCGRRAFIWHAAFDTFRHEFLELGGGVLEVAIRGAMTLAHGAE